MTDSARRALDRLRGTVVSTLGLSFDETRLDALTEAAESRADALGLTSFDDYAARLTRDPAEVRALAQRLTIGETYFFRNGGDLRAFTTQVLPARVAARAAERRLRFLSAGCSSGEEPYTLAMLLEDEPALAGWNVEIVGIDVNPAAVARATAARYGAWSLRQTDDARRERFFVSEGREHRVRDEVRARVRFQERNLVADDPAFWAPGAFDAVFCRNVLMYFDRDVARAVVGRIASALAPGGFLFLGHAETLRGLSTAFHLCHGADSFFYQLRDGAGPDLEPTAAREPARVRAAPAAAPVAVATAGPDLDWLETIRHASLRVERLTTPAAPVAAAPPTAGERLARASALHAEERHAEALEALGGGPAHEETDVDVLLLRAVLLASSGDPAEAERVCARILELDELSAEAHYVKALCREHARDLAGAADHDRYAAYLDPSFAMPRLHLGLLARRAGDLEGARRELARALGLLAAEDAARLLLLGGGFGRAALLDLCRAELRGAGAAG